MEFKNEAVKDIVEVMAKHQLDFESRRAGPTWRNIMIAVSQVYREDRVTIFQMFSSAAPRTQPTNSNPPNITRNKSVSSKSEGCEGCPKGSAVVSSPGVTNVIVKPKDNPQAFVSIEDILERFEESTGAIKAFAQLKGINISGSVKNPNTAAKKLLDGLNELSQEEE